MEHTASGDIGSLLTSTFVYRYHKHNHGDMGRNSNLLVWGRTHTHTQKRANHTEERRETDCFAEPSSLDLQHTTREPTDLTRSIPTPPKGIKDKQLRK